MDKELKTRQELGQMIKRLIRQRPEWRDIVDVTIVERDGAGSHLPNWDAVFTMDGPRVAPEGAIRLVNEFRDNYELSGTRRPVTVIAPSLGHGGG